MSARTRTERRLAQTQDIHPALAAAAAAAGLRGARWSGAAASAAAHRFGGATAASADARTLGYAKAGMRSGCSSDWRKCAPRCRRRNALCRQKLVCTAARRPEDGHGRALGRRGSGPRHRGRRGTAVCTAMLPSGRWLAGQTPQPHHRLHQPRSASGFSAFGGPRHAVWIWRVDGRDLDAARLPTVDGGRRRWPRHPQEGRAGHGDSTSQNVEDIAMTSEAVSELSRSAVHSRLASLDDDMIDDADDRDDISMEL
ncbi:hypothetical protein L1887_63363 [Cichorium endivia]|nr:hypothetical protein L1887_63363 [Cichorium endivia]